MAHGIEQCISRWNMSSNKEYPLMPDIDNIYSSQKALGITMQSNEIIFLKITLKEFVFFLRLSCSNSYALLKSIFTSD